MMLRFSLVSLLAAMAMMTASCSKEMDANDPDAGGDADGDADADGDSDTDGDSDSDTDVEESWEGVGLVSVSAPDEYTVEVRFDGNPPSQDASDPASYAFASEVGVLEGESVEYDPATSTATITTEKQKLGITYTLTVAAQDAPVGLEEDFMSADTATFWVADFASGGYDQYEITATREAVGEHNVVYVEEGWFTTGIAAASSKFDTDTYPIETAMFTVAPDIDDNGKITILGLNGEGYYGGYFSPINAYPDYYTWENWGIHSNEMELIHINVAGGGSFDQEGSIVPHEFQHLLYQEEHPMADWIWHNEGLSESAVRLVNGEYPTAIWYYFADYYGMIGDGDVSLVNWTYAQYENYVLAFMFFAYIASQLDGVDTYGDIFAMASGEPDEVDDFVQAELGLSFGEVQLNQMIAAWVKDDSGIYGYEGFLDLPADLPPRVSVGTSSVGLQPFAGTYFVLEEDTVDYPGTQGEHIVYAGIDSTGAVDLEAPFDKAGGALAVLNANFQYDTYPSEPSGPDIAASGGGSKVMSAVFDLTDPVSTVFESGVPPTWFDPPPYNPMNPEPFFRWKAATAARLAQTPL